MPIEEITHSGIIIWVVGLLGVVGGIIVTIISKVISTLKGNVEKKQDSSLCTVIHTTLNEKLTHIEKVSEKSGDKIDSMDKTLVRIETILERAEKTDTGRYDRHTEEWKDK